MKSRRAKAVILVVVGLLAALIVSTRLNPTYQSRALVSVGMVAATGRYSMDDHLAVARGATVRTAVEGRLGSAAKVDVNVVDDVALEFRVESHDRAEAGDQANAYAQAFVEQRAGSPGAPAILGPARPPESPVPPWPSESWTVAGMILVALALAVPERDAEE